MPDSTDARAMEARDAALVKVLEEVDALTAYVPPSDRTLRARSLAQVGDHAGLSAGRTVGHADDMLALQHQGGHGGRAEEGAALPPIYNSFLLSILLRSGPVPGARSAPLPRMAMPAYDQRARGMATLCLARVLGLRKPYPSEEAQADSTGWGTLTVQGIFDLSRARYSMGASRVGRLQYDARPMTATALLAVVDQAQPTVHLDLIPHPVRVLP